MSQNHQTTLNGSVSFHGKGLHGGRECHTTLSPAPADFGIRFFRLDLTGAHEIPARMEVLSTEQNSRQTVLCAPEDPSATVQTVEHVLAVLHGLGIDNARVEMNELETAILDGSAGEIALRVAQCGVRKIEGHSPRFFHISRPAAFQPAAFPKVQYSVWPSDFLTVTYFLEYDHPFIGSQSATFRIDPEIFLNEIAPARTFCLYEEIEPLIAAGLIKGGEVDNAIVVGPEGPMNTQLLWDNELARHKLLDLIGDLYLLGSRVKGHIVSYRGGHSSNHQLIQYLRKEFPDND